MVQNRAHVCENICKRAQQVMGSKADMYMCTDAWAPSYQSMGPNEVLLGHAHSATQACKWTVADLGTQMAIYASSNFSANLFL